MPTQINTREIEIPYHTDVAGEIAELLSERHREQERSYVQSLSVDTGQAMFCAEVLPPTDLLGEIHDILAESDLEGIPDDAARFSVESVDITVEEIGTIKLGVME